MRVAKRHQAPGPIEKMGKISLVARIRQPPVKIRRLTSRQPIITYLQRKTYEKVAVYSFEGTETPLEDGGAGSSPDRLANYMEAIAQLVERQIVALNVGSSILLSLPN